MGPSPGLAAHQARWHTATCTITRPGAGEPVFNEETGTYTDPPPLEVYSGSCLIVATGADRVVTFGDAPVVLRNYDVEIPDTSVDVQEGDKFTSTGSRDPLLASGRDMVVLDVPKSEMVTIRQLLVEEVL